MDGHSGTCMPTVVAITELSNSAFIFNKEEKGRIRKTAIVPNIIITKIEDLRDV